MFGWFKKKPVPPPPAATAPAPTAVPTIDTTWPQDRPPAPPFDRIAWMRKHEMRYLVSLEGEKHIIINTKHREVLGYVMVVDNQWTLYLTSHGVRFDVFDTAEDAAEELLRVSPKG